MPHDDEPYIHTATLDEFNQMNKVEKLAFINVDGVIIDEPEPLKLFKLQLSKKSPRESKWDKALMGDMVTVKQYVLTLFQISPTQLTPKMIEKHIILKFGSSPSAKQIGRWIKK
jgi:hypothetical protein